LHDRQEALADMLNALYRMPFVLPTLVVGLLLGMLLLLGGCDTGPPPQRTSQAVANTYLEAMQQAEALKHSAEQRDLEQRRLDALLGPGQARPVTR
jgi:hypothetical protein